MRTTVNIDDALLAEAKIVAARGHRSLGQVINDALRFALADRSDGVEPRQTVELPVSGGSGLQPGVVLEDKASVAAAMGDDLPFGAPS